MSGFVGRACEPGRPDKPPGGWNANKNVGQYMWSIVNENPGRWRSGTRFMHYLLGVHKDKSGIVNKVIGQLAHCYQDLLLDWPRAAFWRRKQGRPVPDTGYRAPHVLGDQCVGCGLCQARCHNINVRQKHLLGESAIVVLAGDGREDRLRRGSYLALREKERNAKEARRKKQPTTDEFFIPE